MLTSFHIHLVATRKLSASNSHNRQDHFASSCFLNNMATMFPELTKLIKGLGSTKS